MNTQVARKAITLAITALAFLLLGAPLKAGASPLPTFNASTTSTLTITQIQNYCVLSLYTCSPGLGFSGGATGTDSFGNTYIVGSFGSLFSAAGPPSTWGETPACASTCSSPSENTWFNSVYFTDTNVTGFSSENDVMLSQAADGSITLDLTTCLSFAIEYPGIQVCTASGNLIFDLQVDPAMLANLQPGQSVSLIVLGGCETTGTSCGSGTAPTPEPGTLLLLGFSLPFLGFMRRFARG